ncbi:Lysophospholipase L2 (EC [Kosakonia radicincitans]|nr:Lysophospholipase L2 (EC [Kosakonia radicincitans]
MVTKKRFYMANRGEIPMFRQKTAWETREKAFAAFTTGPLMDFWRSREEAVFTGVDNVLVSFVRFRDRRHDRVIVICPGRIESYVKYAELAYDLFYLGYDVLIIDHRGQGRSGRMLADTHRGHVVNFSDYVDDLAAFWQQEVADGPWRKRYILAHSMGGAISTLFLQRYPHVCNAIALCAPMFGIIIRLPEWMVRPLLDWAESYPRLRDNYAIGTGSWRALPFAINVLTHSRERYRRNLRFYADEPTLRVGGPTWHWVREGILAGEHALAGAANDDTPTLIIQAEEEHVVDNRMQQRFCEIRAAAGHPCEGGKPFVIPGAYHEILFEKDAMRSVALNAIVEFFDRHN